MFLYFKYLILNTCWFYRHSIFLKRVIVSIIIVLKGCVIRSKTDNTIRMLSKYHTCGNNRGKMFISLAPYHSAPLHSNETGSRMSIN